MDFDDLERAVLAVLLAGDDPILETLRSQYATAEVADRDLTGSSVFTSLRVNPSSLPVSPATLHIGDVWFELTSSPDGGEAILWVRDGFLDQLELLARDGNWPDHPQVVDVHYFGGSRDLDALRQQWCG